MSLKRNLALSGAALVLISGMGFRMRQAALRDAVVTHVSSGPSVVARIALAYSPGMRPWSVIVDLLAQNGASGSVTCDGDTTAVEIALSQSFGGAYTLTTTATYRLLGVPKTVVQTKKGTR